MKYIFTLFLISMILLTSLYADVKDENVEALELSFEEVSSEFVPNDRLSLNPVLHTSKIVIDGIIESSWQQSAVFTNFTEYDPAENRKPEVQTRGFITYDQNFLYVAFVCKDPDIGALRANISDRDKMYGDDWVCINIDPNRNQQSAYQFYVNPRGIQGDKLWQSSGSEDEGFDMVWHSNARIYGDYWTVEMKIPFKSIRYPSQNIQDWSIHFIRQYPRESVYKYSWMPISKNNNSLMGQAGILHFVLPKVTSHGNNLEVLPYVVGNQNYYRNLDGVSEGQDSWRSENLESRAGVGIKYGISSNMIVDFTYNPDFSQIESDAGQVSVNNPFALFYDEKRPFFQEGSEIYTVDRGTNGAALDQQVNLFYSRSINDPLMAGKLSAKVGKLSLGLTSALDQSTPFVIPFEENSAVLATTKNSYNNIVRASYDLGNQSSVGLFTSDRHFTDNGSNTVAAVDARFRLSQRYSISGLAAVTHTREINDPELSSSIQEGTFDAGNKTYTNALDGESFTGTLLRGKIHRDSRKWEAVVAYSDYSPGFRADNGFLQNNAFRNMDVVNNYNFRFDDHPWFTNIQPRVSVWRKYNYDGVIKDTGLRTNIAFFLKKQTFVSLSAFIFNRENVRGKQFDDARLAWISAQNNTLKSLLVSGFFQLGRQINRFGVEGDVRNPFELVPSMNYSVTAVFRPQARFNNGTTFSQFVLWTDYGENKIVGQRLLQNSLTYQINKTMFIRLIGEYNVVDYYSTRLGEMVNQKTFSVDPLFSYKLNAFTAFYLGGHFGGYNNIFYNRPDVDLTNSSIFLKFQYLLRV